MKKNDQRGVKNTLEVQNFKGLLLGTLKNILGDLWRRKISLSIVGGFSGVLVFLLLLILGVFSIQEWAYGGDSEVSSVSSNEKSMTTSASATHSVSHPISSAAPASLSTPSSKDAALQNMPLNEMFQGLHIPQWNAQGKMVLLLDAREAKRIDDTHLQMEDLKIEMPDAQHSNFVVELPHAIFDLKTRILESHTPMRIQRKDFVLEGDSLRFDTQNRVGRIQGKVTMVIFNASLFSPSSTPAEEKGEKK